MKREYNYNTLIIEEVRNLSVLQKIGIVLLIGLLLAFYILSFQFLLS